MTRHIVRKGETLWSIAKCHSVDYRDLALANGISDPKKIYIGQVVTIPSNRTRNLRQHQPANPKRRNKAASKEIETIRDEDSSKTKTCSILFEWLEELLQRLRFHEAEEHVQKTDTIDLTPQKGKPAVKHEAAAKKNSKGKQKLHDVKQKIRESLNKEPHVITFNGVRLTENEKKQIVAAVACCEMNSDGFGSINADAEFVGRKFGQRGIETSYSRILHIGLSYGVIQFTQDSGSLGIVLKKMQQKNPTKFLRIFAANNKSVADALIALTNDGRADLQDNNQMPLSGQALWNKIKRNVEGKNLKELAAVDKDGDGRPDLPASKEIRGRRVQPISANPSDPPTDLWTGTWKQRFLDAGNEVDFQEAQLECAVAMYMDPILPLAKKYKVRSALGLAFVTACSIRGNPTSPLPHLLFDVAKEIGVSLPFENSEDEISCVKRIAESAGSIGKIKFDSDESRRAKLLLADELSFLVEDLYDLSTY